MLRSPRPFLRGFNSGGVFSDPTPSLHSYTVFFARAIHDENMRRIDAFIDQCIKNKKPFPANSRRPNQPSMEKIAREAGVKREVLLHHASHGRRKIEAAVEQVGLAVQRRTEKSVPRLSDLTEVVVAALRAELEAEGLPSQIHVKALRETARLIAKVHPDGMSTDAALAIGHAVANAPTRKPQFNRQQKSALDRLNKYLEELEGVDGLPESFSEALSLVCAQTGLDMTTVARLADIRPQALINYCAGRRNPDPRNAHKIARVEHIANLPPSNLVSRIKSNRMGQGRIPAAAYPEGLRGKENTRLRGEVSRLLPAEIASMEESERHRVINQAHHDVMARKTMRRRRGALLTMPYALKVFPAKLEADCAALAAHKEAAVPTPGMLQGWRWKPGTTQRGRDQVASVAGFLAPTLPELVHSHSKKLISRFYGIPKTFKRSMLSKPLKVRKRDLTAASHMPMQI